MSDGKVGRPRVITDEVQEAILRTIRLGLHQDRAAMAHGVSSATMRSFKRRHPEFAKKVKEALRRLADSCRNIAQAAFASYVHDAELLDYKPPAAPLDERDGAWCDAD